MPVKALFKFGIAWALLFFSGLNGTVQADEETHDRRYAFLVGVSEYQFRPAGLQPLKFADDDVWGIRDALVNKRGWNPKNIVVLATPTPGRKATAYPSLVNIIQQWRILTARIVQDGQATTGSVRDGSLIVHLSGHGIEAGSKEIARSLGIDPGRTYFIPGDARKLEKAQLLDVATLMDGGKFGEAAVIGLGEVPLDRRLLLYDACRTRAELAGRRIAASPLASLSTHPLPNGLMVLFSCHEGQESFEDTELRRGLFSHGVIKGLEGEAMTEFGEITIDSLVAYVKGAVKARARTRGLAQSPFSRGAVGDWVLARRDPNDDPLVGAWVFDATASHAAFKEWLRSQPSEEARAKYAGLGASMKSSEEVNIAKADGTWTGRGKLVEFEGQAVNMEYTTAGTWKRIGRTIRSTLIEFNGQKRTPPLISTATIEEGIMKTQSPDIPWPTFSRKRD